jgi:hypothetical protein
MGWSERRNTFIHGVLPQDFEKHGAPPNKWIGLKSDGLRVLSVAEVLQPLLCGSAVPLGGIWEKLKRIHQPK